MAIFQNQATLTYGGVTVQSNVVSGQIAETLAFAKTAQSESYGEDPVVFFLSLVNSGVAPFTGLTLRDDLGAYEFNGQTVYPFSYVEGSVVYFVNGVQQPDPVVQAQDGVTFTGVNVPAGGSAILAYAALPTAYAPRAAGEGVTNRASAEGAGLQNPLSAEAVVTALLGVRLRIEKSLSPAVVQENGVLNYTFLIENSGSEAADASGNVTVRDVFSPRLSGLTVLLDGAPLSAGTGYTYDEATGEFATVPGVITVPAATAAQDASTGEYIVTPGSAVLQVSGTI